MYEEQSPLIAGHPDPNVSAFSSLVENREALQSYIYLSNFSDRLFTGFDEFNTKKFKIDFVKF